MATVTCCAYNCGNKYGREGITFHRFPLDKPHVLAKWLVAMGKPKWAPSKDHFLCSEHFTDEMFNEKGGYRFVKYDAIPTKFHVLPKPKAFFPPEFAYRLLTVREVEEDFSKGYVVEAKICLETEEDFYKWLKEHEKLAKVNYRLRQRYSNAPKNLAFKSEFACRYGTGTLKPSSSESGCPAKLLVRIRSRPSSKFGKVKDQDLAGYCCTVVLYHLHTHRVESNLFNESNIAVEDVSEEVRQKYLEMFKGGCTAEQAYKLHQQDITEDYGECCEDVLSDHYNCPEMEWVNKLYEKFVQDTGGFSESKVISMIEKEISAINAEEGKVKMHTIDEHIVVAICTPLMQRAHSLKPAGDIVFLESSGLMDLSKCYMYILMAYSCSEGLPLGVLISTSESENVLTAGFALLAEILPEKAFCQLGREGPEVLLTANNDGEQASIRKVFSASTLYLCSMSLLRDLWCWLWDSNNGIKEEDRPYLFSCTYELMKTMNADSFNDCFSSTLQNQTATKYENFVNYFKQIANLSEKWAIRVTNDISEKEKVVSAVEMASLVLKDRFYLTKAYSLPQLISFVAKDLEGYYKQKIIHCINNTLEKYIQSSYKSEMRMVDDLELQQLSTGQHKVVSKKSGTTFYVDSRIFVCTCNLGMTGARCKHQFAVFLRKRGDVESYILDDTIKRDLHWIATNSMNSLLESMEPDSGSDLGYDEMDDEEYDPRTETQKKFKARGGGSAGTGGGGAGVSKRGPLTPKDEAKAILDRVVRDIIQRYDSNPTEYHKAIVATAVNYQSLHYDHAILAALKNFGKNVSL